MYVVAKVVIAIVLRSVMYGYNYDQVSEVLYPHTGTMAGEELVLAALSSINTRTESDHRSD